MKLLKSILLLCLCCSLLFTVTACDGGEDEWEEVIVTQTQKVSKTTTADGGEEVIGGQGTTTRKEQAVTRTTIQDGNLINATTLTAQEEIFKNADLKDTTLTFVFGSQLSNYKDKTDDNSWKDIYAWDTLQKKWGIKLKHLVYDNKELAAQVGTLIASGDPPDMGHVDDSTMMRYAYTNRAIPLNDYLVTNDKVWDNGGCFKNFTFNDKIYGIGWHSQEDTNLWIYYNKAIFKEKGLDDPYQLYLNDKWDTNAFKRLAMEATIFEADGKTVKVPGVACSQQMLFPAMFGEAGITFDEEAGKWKVTLDTAAGMQGLQLVHDLYAAKALVMQGGMQAKFGQRGSSMLIDRPKNAVGNYDYYNTMTDGFGMVPLPKAPDGKYYAYTVCDGTFVFKGAKNPVGAVAYRYYCRLFERYTSDKEKVDAGYGVDEIVNYNAEHLAMVQNHLNNKVGKVLMSSMSSLVNWGDGAKHGPAFWDDLTKKGIQPAQLMDSVKSQLNLCLRSTVGVGNTVG